MEKETFLKKSKKYAGYLVAGTLVLALAITIIVTGGNLARTDNNISPATNPVISVGANPVSVLSFTLPMMNATVIKDFSSTQLYLNQTLNKWEYHDGIDFVASDLSVYAVADGVVSEVYSDYAFGNTVVITHSNNLKSVYSSLSSNVLVEVGDDVQKNQKIGTADQSASNEQADGAHLHFKLIEDNQNIDPANYLDLEVK
ncbi:MAG: M23 family metallopeptidase [Clostridia bacterium]|nr:M23 family metallopeptidase [Clostridia bacterium]